MIDFWIDWRESFLLLQKLTKQDILFNLAQDFVQIPKSVTPSVGEVQTSLHCSWTILASCITESKVSASLITHPKKFYPTHLTRTTMDLFKLNENLRSKVPVLLSQGVLIMLT